MNSSLLYIQILTIQLQTNNRIQDYVLITALLRYNSHTKNSHFKVYKSDVFSTFTELHNYYHYVMSAHFYQKETLRSLVVAPHSSPLHSPRRAAIHFCLHGFANSGHVILTQSNIRSFLTDFFHLA